MKKPNLGDIFYFKNKIKIRYRYEDQIDEKFFGNDLKEIESASDFNYYLSFIGGGNEDVITHKVISRIENLLKEMYPDLSINPRSKGEPKFF